SNTRFLKACADSAHCQIMRAMSILISSGAMDGIQAAMLTRSERSQKKNRFSTCAVSSRIHRARGCVLNRIADSRDIAFAAVSRSVPASTYRRTIVKPIQDCQLGLVLWLRLRGEEKPYLIGCPRYSLWLIRKNALPSTSLCSAHVERCE